MTKNKFWLVMSGMLGMLDSKVFKYFTLDEAIKSANYQSFINHEQNYYVLEETHHFKADVNVVETNLSAPENDFVELAEPTPEESLAVEPMPKFKFKVGDRIEHRNYGFGKIVNKKPIYPDIHDYTVSFDIFRDGFKVYCAANDLTLAEPQTPTDFDKRCTSKPSFKVGDKVKYINKDIEIVLEYPIELGVVIEIRDCKDGVERVYVKKQNTSYDFFNKEDLTLVDEKTTEDSSVVGDAIFTEGKYGVIQAINTYNYEVIFEETGFEYVSKLTPMVKKGYD